MKTYMKKLLGGAMLGLTLVASTVPTWAGSASQQEVTIYRDTKGRVFAASGAMAAARYSSDGVQNIGCLGGSGGAVCHAEDRSGLVFSCNTNDARVASAVRTMTPSSYIFFSGTRTGICDSIYVNNGSSNLR